MVSRKSAPLGITSGFDFAKKMRRKCGNFAAAFGKQRQILANFVQIAGVYQRISDHPRLPAELFREQRQFLRIGRRQI